MVRNGWGKWPLTSAQKWQMVRLQKRNCLVFRLVRKLLFAAQDLDLTESQDIKIYQITCTATQLANQILPKMTLLLHLFLQSWWVHWAWQQLVKRNDRLWRYNLFPLLWLLEQQFSLVQISYELTIYIYIYIYTYLYINTYFHAIHEISMVFCSTSLSPKKSRSSTMEFMLQVTRSPLFFFHPFLRLEKPEPWTFGNPWNLMWSKRWPGVVWSKRWRICMPFVSRGWGLRVCFFQKAFSHLSCLNTNRTYRIYNWFGSCRCKKQISGTQMILFSFSVQFIYLTYLHFPTGFAG